MKLRQFGQQHSEERGVGGGEGLKWPIPFLLRSKKAPRTVTGRFFFSPPLVHIICAIPLLNEKKEVIRGITSSVHSPFYASSAVSNLRPPSLLKKDLLSGVPKLPKILPLPSPQRKDGIGNSFGSGGREEGGPNSKVTSTKPGWRAKCGPTSLRLQSFFSLD